MPHPRPSAAGSLATPSVPPRNPISLAQGVPSQGDPRWTAVGLCLLPKDWKLAPSRRHPRTNLANIFGFQVNTNLNIPVTYEQKELRVEHLPYYLEKILPGRFLPKAEIKGIQGDLFAVDLPDS